MRNLDTPLDTLPPAAGAASDPAAARVRREQEFHNRVFADATREHLGRWYAAVRAGEREQDRLVRLLSAGKTVLEYGCADGSLSLRQLRLHETARELHGIDISDYAIQNAALGAAELGCSERSHFHVMNGEAMDFPNGYFDLVFGRAIIHHLELDACFREVSRVLKDDGIAIFYEPMGHNPLLNWYRRRTPELRSADEHPIVESDFEIAKKSFAKVVGRSYGLTTLAAVPLGSQALLRRFESLDRFLFRFRSARRNAWFTLIVAHKAG